MGVENSRRISFKELGKEGFGDGEENPAMKIDVPDSNKGSAEILGNAS